MTVARIPSLSCPQPASRRLWLVREAGWAARSSVDVEGSNTLLARAVPCANGGQGAMSLDDRIAANRQQQRAMLERQQALLANIRRSQDSLLASSGTGGPDDRVAQASSVREDEFHGTTTSVSLDDLRTTQRSTREAHTAAASTGGHNSTLGGGHDGGSGLVAEMDAVLQRQSHSTSLSTSRRASATATATAAATATAVASRSTTTVHDRYSEVHGGAVSSAPSGVAGTAASAELLSTMTGLRTARSGNHNTTLPGEHGGHSDHHATYDDRRGGSAALNMSHTSHASHRSLAEEAQSVDLLRQQLAHVHKIRADSQQKGVLVSQFREQLQELGRFKQQAFQLRSQVGSLEERLLNREAELARATAELSQRSQQLVATEQRFKQQLKVCPKRDSPSTTPCHCWLPSQLPSLEHPLNVCVVAWLRGCAAHRRGPARRGAPPRGNRRAAAHRAGTSTRGQGGGRGAAGPAVDDPALEAGAGCHVPR